MIYVEMYGRLGNQFFRYATARAIQQKFYPHEQLCLNFMQVEKAAKKDKTFYNTLDDFTVKPYLKYRKDGKVILKESSISQKLVCIPYYLGLRKISTEQMNEQVNYEKKWSKRLNKAGVYWFRNGYIKPEKSTETNKFVSGNLESPQYFDAIKDDLIKEFTPKYALLNKNKNFYNRIISTDSVCISIRRGDFESNSEIKKLHSICNKEYFMQAINIINSIIVDPVFFVFSDDIEWAKKNIKINGKSYFEDGSDPIWEKLRLMSGCKNFIISNSTFSWWCQYLSTNENKIVVAPSRWFNNNYSSPLLDKKWIKINV